MKQITDDIIAETLSKNYTRYYRLAFSYVHNEADALDIVQEGAYKAIMNSGSLKNIDYLDTWLYRIMMNESINSIRKNPRTFEDLDTIESSTADSYEDLDLKNAVELLEEPDKTIIKLRFFEELKLEQIAAIINENLNTTKSRLYRSLKKLRLSLEE